MTLVNNRLNTSENILNIIGDIERTRNQRRRIRSSRVQSLPSVLGKDTIIQAHTLPMMVKSMPHDVLSLVV